MDQKKIGCFIKELRKDRNLTQEEFAEKFCVARRTVSRWETGNNMPDMDILIEMADFFEVDLREILDGERKNESMDKEMKEMVLKVTEYDQENTKKMSKIVLCYFIIGIIALITHEAFELLELKSSMLTGFFDGFTIGIALAVMILGILFVTGLMVKIRAAKLRLLGIKER